MNKINLFQTVLFILIGNINGRSFPTNPLTESDSIEILNEYNVVPRNVLTIHSKDNDQQYEIKLGQVSGLVSSVKNPNILFIYHRGSREWNQESFPDGIHFDRKNFGPIIENTILTVDTRNGQILNQWANSTFSMPHGLSIDREENLWLTDVAMHQVFKYSRDGQLILTLGESFVPGNDEKHFCKPTDVAVSNDGSKVFVADGYCNSRIAIFDSNGIYLGQYKIEDNLKQLSIPHSLALIESLDLLCVADRENSRIVCFDSGLDDNDDDEGQIKIIVKHPQMKRVYAITYDANKQRLYAVSGPNYTSDPLGFTFNADRNNFGQLIQTWKPKDNFVEPHDLTLNANGESLFVGEVRPNRIDSFDVIN